ncbi:MAG: right-handed parallel beta-helix repeat-containing protein, partial [Bacteroidales bacterium]
GFAHDINISHNELSHLNYSGICIGWGWTKTITCMKNNMIHANYIHHFAKNMYDVGGIYTLSAQPNTEISGNRIEHLEKAPYAHIPDHYQYIYLDEGSSYIRVKDNWTEKDKFFSNSPGPGNEWLNNGPQVDSVIKENAGLRERYKDLLQ